MTVFSPLQRYSWIKRNTYSSYDDWRVMTQVSRLSAVTIVGVPRVLRRNRQETKSQDPDSPDTWYK